MASFFFMIFFYMHISDDTILIYMYIYYDLFCTFISKINQIYKNILC